uniref:Uncharacterized protein n=1 Tax=viral metagenome TaxID=1070528 RepID=A0A6C0EJR4_9ZZZZ
MTSNLLNLSLLKNSYNILINLSKKTTESSQILEPLTTLITLAIISFKTVGTKITVSSNKVYIQEPTLIQGVIRWSFGSNREEIHYLLKPLFRCVHLYDPDENPDLKLLYEFAIDGLKLLKKSYNSTSSNLSHTLDLYIGILECTIKSEKIKIDSFRDFRSLTNLNLSEFSKVNLDNLFKNIWTVEEIKIVCSMLTLSKNNSNNIKSYISGIESILIAKEKNINNIIKDTNNLF